MVLAATLVATKAADDKPFGGPPGPPSRHVEERPFGGPPPKQRGTMFGKKCQTPQRACELEKRRAVGAKCTCPGEAAEGKVVQ
jgi:hypothetical protein